MELFISSFVWTSAVVFSLYSVFIFGRETDKSLIYPEDLVPGWSFIGKHRDVSDYEWNSWKRFAIKLLPWTFIGHFVSEILRWNTKTIILKRWRCFIVFLFIIFHFGLFTLIVMLTQPMIYWFVLHLRLKMSSVWSVTSIFLAVTNLVKYMHENDTNYFLSHFDFDEDDFYIVLVSTSWIQLRCMSYCFEAVWSCSSDKYRKKNGLLDLLSYCFYLPMLFLGPIILWCDFKNSSSSRTDFRKRSINLVLNTMRFLCWLVFLEVCLHFIYFNALQYNLEVVYTMPDWCLYGGGLWMGLHFYLKYLITYGLASSLTAFDGIQTETPPLCIARVHLYSQMWRYFDVGLHKFLIRYIYKPVISNAARESSLYIFVRSFASLLCFIFVLFWHGTHSFILVWTALNFFGIILENVGVLVSKCSTYQMITSKLSISQINKERINALISAPILVMSAISNFYFFAGAEVGIVYVYRVLNQTIPNAIGMLFCLYCCCRTSQFLINIRTKKLL